MRQIIYTLTHTHTHHTQTKQTIYAIKFCLKQITFITFTKRPKIMEFFFMSKTIKKNTTFFVNLITHT